MVTIIPVISAGIPRTLPKEMGISFRIAIMTPLKPAMKAERLKTALLGWFDKTITPNATNIGRFVRKLFSNPFSKDLLRITFFSYDIEHLL